MSSSLKTFLIVAGAVVVVSVGLIVLAGKNPQKTAEQAGTESGEVAGVASNEEGAEEQSDSGYVERLAKYLSEKGVVMYGTYWCSYCKKQKELFGDAFKYVDYVECDAKGPNANPDECLAQKIEGYPTWIYEGQKYSGVQPLAKLAQIAGFSQ